MAGFAKKFLKTVSITVILYKKDLTLERRAGSGFRSHRTAKKIIALFKKYNRLSLRKQLSNRDKPSKLPELKNQQGHERFQAQVSALHR